MTRISIGILRVLSGANSSYHPFIVIDISLSLSIIIERMSDLQSFDDLETAFNY